MPRTPVIAPDTRTRLLDAAEELIAEKGFRSVSLRQITRNAGVNTAAVNYHFGSREALVAEVLARVIKPINQQRLHLLDLAEARHHGPVPLEEILEAMHRPVVAEMKKSPLQTPAYLRLAGRCLSEPTANFSDTLVELFREVIVRFMAATRATLPHLDDASIFWRMHFSVGTMIYALTHEDRLLLFSGGIIKSTDPEDTLRRLIEFTAAGMGARSSAAGAAVPSSARGRTCKGLKAIPSLAIAASLLFLASCESLSPPDAKHHASLKAPAHWIAASSYHHDFFPDSNWIESFRDPALSDYVGLVMRGNKDLKVAQSRIEIAQANARIAGADLYPRVQGGFNGQREQQIITGFPLGPPGVPLSSLSNRFGLSLALSWEIDLWGRIAAGKSAFVAEFEASGFDRSTAELSLAGQAAKTWFALAEAKEQVQLARSAIATFGDTESAIRERFEQGIEENGQNLASQLLLAEADVANAREALASREELLGRTARQLELLAGSYPAGSAGKSATLPGLPGRIPADLPATLLDRRPDLAASERRIAAADKRLIEAKRSLLPALSLTGSYGTVSDDIGDLLDSDFSVWSVAGNLAQPILQGGRLRANVSKRDSELQLSATEFEKAALTAFAEVENALAAETYLNRRVDALSEATRLALAAYQRSLEEFELGTGDILTVLTSQQRLFTSRSQLLGVKRMRLDNRIDLHLALGGSFAPYEGPQDKSPES